MNKGLVALLGSIVVAMLGVVGGYIYAEYAIKSQIEATFANAAHMHGIDSATYQAIDVNLIGNSVTLSGVDATFDAKTLLEQYGDLPPEVSAAGSVTESIEAVRLVGVRDVLFGDTTLSAMHAKGTTVLFDITVSEQRPEGPSVGMNAKMTTTIAGLAATGVDVSAYLGTETPSVEDYLAFTAKSLSANTLVVKGDIHALNAVDGTPKAPVSIDYRVASLGATDITSKSYGSVWAEDISIRARPATKDEAKTVHVTASRFAISEARFVESVPVKIAYELNDVVLKPGSVPDPKFQAGLAVVGIDEINMDFKMAYDVDPDTGIGDLGPLVMNLKKVGQIDLALGLTGLPGIDVLKRLQDAPDSFDDAQVETILSAIGITNATLGYSDGGILKKFIAAQAMQMTNGKIAPVADGFARQGAGLVAMSHGPQKAQEVYETLKTYLTDPGEISISLDAEDAVNLKTLIESANVVGPQALGAFALTVRTPN